MQNYLGDVITRIRNGHQARLGAVLLHSATPKSCVKILEVLREEGYILGFQEWNDEITNRQFLKVLLKYNRAGRPAIGNIFQVSKPGRRVYVSTKSLWKPKSTAGMFILATPKGVLTDRDARLFNAGGELLLGVY